MSFDFNFFMFGLFPYFMLTVLILGSIIRFDRDPYSWRSKSSQLLRKKHLAAASNLFHVGILVVLAGHAVGLLTPLWVFEALGISHGFKQVMAMTVGGIFGAICLVGLLMLLYRRLFDARIRATSSWRDIIILVLLLAQLLLGLGTITVSAQHLDGVEMVKFMNWVQHIVTFQADAAEFVRDVSPIFKAHLILGQLIFLVFPFTRLVHAWSAPWGYIFRSQYQIVRRREV
ncbi:MAG: respiratory nitrate reductase subunit gamma [Alphaproteobacteria bacterium]|nr:respiratory nitrate reductase subunit gamma [Alphaproteobacteria bacterium]